MKKWAFFFLVVIVTIGAFVYFNGNGKRNISVMVALEEQGIKLKEMESLKEFELIGVQPRVYALGEQEEIVAFIKVFEFGSEEKRELALQEHEKRQMMYSSLGPIAFEKGQVLVLHYPDDNANVNEKMQKALQSLNFEQAPPWSPFNG